MRCDNGNSKINTDSSGCSECGNEANSGRMVGDSLAQSDYNDHATRVSPGLIEGADKVTRWTYEMNMWKNPVILFTAWKVLLLAALVPALLMFFLTIIDGDGLIDGFTIFIYIYGICIGIISALLVLAYPIVTLLNGGKYCVVFEMDEQGIKHIQMQKQYEKARVIAAVTVAAGILTGSAQAAGAGLLAGSKQQLYSKFADVKTLIVDEARNIIYLNGRFCKNQVYAENADFAYVRDYIVSRCKKAIINIKPTRP